MVFYILGIILMAIGCVYFVFPSPRIGYKYGYRTPRAKISDASYAYAQKIASKTFLFIGFLTFAIGFLLKYFGLVHFFIIEIILITIPITRIFYVVERNLEKFNDKEEGVNKNEITNG